MPNIAENSSFKPEESSSSQVVPVKNSKEGLYSKPLLVRTRPQDPVAPVIDGFNYTNVPGEIIVNFKRKWTIDSGILREFKVGCAQTVE